MPATVPANTYSLTGSFTHVRINATSGAFTLYLPPSSSFLGQELSVVKTDNSANIVTLSPAQNSSDVINGSNTLSTQWQSARFRCISNGWDKT